MFRFKLIIIIITGVVAYKGYDEFSVSRGTTDEPVPIELSVLETDNKIENNHLKIQNHMALYAHSIYEYTTKKGSTAKINDNTKVTTTYYPIISREHSYVGKLKEIYDKYGEDTSEIPDNEWPTVANFTVLVKTEKFTTIGAIPEEFKFEDGVQGLIINRIYTLDNEEKSLISQNFPNINFNNILVLEEGRTPASVASSFGMMGGGGIFCLLGVLSLFSTGKDSK